MTEEESEYEGRGFWQVTGIIFTGLATVSWMSTVYSGIFLIVLNNTALKNVVNEDIVKKIHVCCAIAAGTCAIFATGSFVLDHCLSKCFAAR